MPRPISPAEAIELENSLRIYRAAVKAADTQLADAMKSRLRKFGIRIAESVPTQKAGASK